MAPPVPGRRPEIARDHQPSDLRRLERFALNLSGHLLPHVVVQVVPDEFVLVSRQRDASYRSVQRRGTDCRPIPLMVFGVWVLRSLPEAAG